MKGIFVSRSYIKISIMIFVLLIFQNLSASEEIFDLAAKGNLDKVRMLIGQNPDLIHKKDRRGSTPLFHAARGGHLQIVKLLLKNGADINILNSSGRPPLFWAAYKGHSRVLKYFLDNGAKFKQKDNRGFSPMEWAAMRKRKDIVDIFISKGAKPSLVDAAGCGHISLMKKLIKAGADLNQTNKSGNTPLHMAALCNQKDFVLELLKIGAKMNEKNDDGETPLDVAIEREKPEIEKILNARGAKNGPLPDPKLVQIVPNIFRIYFPIGMMTNTLVQTGPDGILIIDTGFMKRSVKILKDKILKTGKGNIEYLVNSHNHWDHIAGNKIADNTTQFIGFENLDKLQKQGILSTGSGKLSEKSGKYFGKHYILKYNDDKILFIPHPGIHSSKDIIIYFSNAGVVHMGDLLLSENFPAVGSGLDKYFELLEKLLSTFPGTTYFLSGHGKALNYKGLKAYYKMLKSSSLMVKNAIKKGISVEDAIKNDLLKDFNQYNDFLPFLKTDSWIRNNYRYYARKAK